MKLVKQITASVLAAVALCGFWSCVSEVPEWVTISPTQGSAGTTDVTVSVTDNMREGAEDNPRKATLVFKGSTLASRAEVIISQNGDKYRDVEEYTPGQVAELMFAESTRLAREGFWAIFLDRRRVPLRPEPDLLTLGLGAQTLIDPQTLFRKAVMFDAHGLILVHNHPSGDVSPSTQDVETTRALITAGRVLGIPVLDHVIVGRPDISPSYFSLRTHELCDF